MLRLSRPVGCLAQSVGNSGLLGARAPATSLGPLAGRSAAIHATRGFAIIRLAKPAGLKGKMLKDRRKKRLKHWHEKQERRALERQEAMVRLGTEDVEWYEGQYYPRAELKAMFAERLKASQAYLVNLSHLKKHQGGESATVKVP
jgi:hypothetical protein